MSSSSSTTSFVSSLVVRRLSTVALAPLAADSLSTSAVAVAVAEAVFDIDVVDETAKKLNDLRDMLFSLLLRLSEILLLLLLPMLFVAFVVETSSRCVVVWMSLLVASE